VGLRAELLVEMPLAKHVFPTFLHEQVFGVNRLGR
jgi:hypothetical protein